MKRVVSCLSVVFLLLIYCSSVHAATAVKKNGVCGSVNGTSVSSKPASNLCGSGITASAVNGTGPWNWYCYGVGGGANATCSANTIPLNVNQFAPNMKQNGSVNIIVGGGKSPYSLTANPASAVSIAQNGNSFNVTAKENGKTVALVIRDSNNSTLNKSLTIAKADPPKDITKPTVTFSLTPSSITQGASVTLNYTVADAGGIKQVELWRSSDNKNWTEVTGQRKTLSGNGPISGSFTDTPPAVGTYYYGITPVDNSGNKGESGSKSVTVTAKVVSLMAVSLSLDKLAPFGTSTMTVTGGTPPYKISSIAPLNSLTVKATGNNTFTVAAGVIATTATITVQDASSVSRPVTKTIIISAPPPKTVPLTVNESNKFGKAWPPDTSKIHTGVDFNVSSSTAGKKVLFNAPGTVKKIHKDSTGWGYCVVIAPDSNSNTTYVVWHLDLPGVSEGQHISSGQLLGKAYSLGGNSHVHLGYRAAPFDSVESMKGALPKASFPEKFQNPPNWGIISITE